MLVLPYVNAPDFHIGPVPLHPFGLLVATGVLIGTWLATWRARVRGVDLDKLNSFITWMLVAGFIGGHVLDTIFYHPTEIARIDDGHFHFTRPWSIFLLWEGLSSFGGFIGGLVGVLLWKFYWLEPRFALGPIEIAWFSRRAKTLPVLPFCDLILSVFPVAWIFGRSGCSSVHDHPGAVASPDALFAVAYPFSDPREHPHTTELLIHGHFPRYDLGTLELFFTIVLATMFALTWWKKLPTGTYVAGVALAYAPVRFAMDYLRLPDAGGGDLRYGGLTPAQWACIGLFTFGLVLVAVIRRNVAKGIDRLDELMAPPPESDPEPQGALRQGGHEG